MKYKSIILGVVLFTLVLGIFSYMGDSYAYFDYNADSISLEEGAKDPKYWHQGTCPADNGITLGSSGKSVGAAACGYFSVSFILVKMGAMDPSKDNPIELVKWAKEGNHLLSGGWHINFNDLPSRYSDLKVGKDGDGSFDYVPQGKKGSDIVAYCKQKFSEGYFVDLCMGRADGGAHYITVDGFDDNGNMIIADSAYTPTTEPKLFNSAGNYGSHGNYYDCACSYAVLFKMDGVDPATSPSIYGGSFKGVEVSEEEKKAYESMVSEFELKGMKGYDFRIADTSNNIDLLDMGTLTLEETNSLEGIKDNIQAKKFTINSFVNIVVMLIGLSSIVYSVLLVICAICDMSNNWIDISLVEKFTFHRCKVITDDLDEYQKKRLMTGDFTLKQWFIRCSILFIGGVLIISGLIQKLVSLVLGWIILGK